MFRYAISVFTLGVLPLAAQTPPEPLSLEQALEIADRANPDYQLARLQIAGAEAQAAVVKSGLKPQLTAFLQAAYQTTNLQGIGLTFPGVPDRVGPFSTFNVRPQLTQTVFDAQLLANTRAARARVVLTREQSLTVREQVRAAVIDFYLLALQASSRLRAAEARVRSFDAIRQQVADRVEAGSANQLDLARAVEQVERARIQVTYAKRDRDVITTQLVRALGITVTGPAELRPVAQTVALPLKQDDALALAMAERPEMKSVLARRAVLEQELKAAQRERWPKFGIAADAGAYGATIPSVVSTYTVAGTATIPIWTSGRIENEIKGTKIRLEQWEQERRQTELAISQEVAQACLEAQAAETARKSAGLAADAARQSLELAKLRYEAGMTTNLDVVTAQSNLSEAEEEEIRTTFDGLLARARLARAQGDARGFLTAR